MEKIARRPQSTRRKIATTRAPRTNLCSPLESPLISNRNERRRGERDESTKSYFDFRVRRRREYRNKKKKKRKSQRIATIVSTKVNIFPPNVSTTGVSLSRSIHDRLIYAISRSRRGASHLLFHGENRGAWSQGRHRWLDGQAPYTGPTT